MDNWTWQKWILSGYLPYPKIYVTSDFDRADLKIIIGWYFTPAALDQCGGPWIVEQTYGGGAIDGCL